MEDNLKQTVKRYFFSFVLYCMVGWIYEVALGYFYGYGFENRGFLNGPYLPVYGFGAIMLIVALGKIMKQNRKLGPAWLTPLLIFILIVVITTAIELATSYAMELIFHKRWWNYSDRIFNFDGRICLLASIRFGIGGMVFLYVLQPVFNALIRKIPQKMQTVLVVLLGAVLLADLSFTLKLFL